MAHARQTIDNPNLCFVWASIVHSYCIKLSVLKEDPHPSPTTTHFTVVRPLAIYTAQKSSSVYFSDSQNRLFAALSMWEERNVNSN